MRKTKFELIREFLIARLGPRIGPMVASVLWPVYLVARFLDAILRKLNRKSQIYYECRVAPFMAKNLPWLFWPIYKLLKSLNICFVVNIADGVGHIIAELDNFFRKQHLGEIAPNKRYLFIRKSSELSKACVDFYGHKFWWAIANNFIYDLLLPITVRYKDITLDSGLSRLKWQLTDNNEYYLPLPGQTYLHRISKIDGQTRWTDYYKRRLKCSEYFPLKEATFDNSQLTKFLNGNTEKLALIHIRTRVMNATAKLTDPETYLDTLAYLSDLGYQLIFVGREKMPEAFRQYGLINYSESDIASFKNDIQLFNLADIAIIAGSGISFLADCYDKPHLYLNSWHLNRPMFSRNCICVPTLVQKPSGELLKFTEQSELYLSITEAAEVFPAKHYQARNATPDEILMATQEMISLKENYKERSTLQEQFRQLDNKRMLGYSEVRCSEYFLKKHSGLL